MNTYMLPCSHETCTYCWERWSNACIDSCQQPTCPCCRVIVEKYINDATSYDEKDIDYKGPSDE